MAFNSYHRLVYDGLKKEFGLILSTTESMTPCLLKIEEFLFGTRSLRCCSTFHTAGDANLKLVEDEAFTILRT